VRKGFSHHTVHIYLECLGQCTPYHNVANLVTVTKMNMIDEMPSGYGTLRTTAVRIWHPVSCRAAQRSQLLSKSPADLRRGLKYFNRSLPYMSNLVASQMHLRNCRYFQENLRMLLQSLRAPYLTAGGPGRIGSTSKHSRG